MWSTQMRHMAYGTIREIRTHEKESWLGQGKSDDRL